MSRRSAIDTLLAPRTTALVEVLPAALAGDADAVHRARVSSRRVREVLPPLRGLRADEAIDVARREVRRVTRALGPLRELDVTMGLFEELSETHAVNLAAREVMRQRLIRDRDAALRAARRALPDRRRERVALALHALTGPDPDDALPRLTAAVADRVRRRSGQVRQALDQAGALYVAERLHAVRIAVKRLRYALEVTGALRRSRASARIAQLRAIQDLLGRAHDLQVLGDRLRRTQTRVVRRSRATAGELGRLAEALDEACRAEHAAFMSRRRGLITLCDALEAPPAPPRRWSVA